MPGIQTILHPTDFSENARYAFQSACALARDNHATLLVLHVMMPSVSPLVQEQPLPDPLQSAESQESLGNCPGPNRRTRRFVWSIGWRRETPRRDSALDRDAALRPHRDGHSRQDGAGTTLDRQRGGRGLAKGALPRAGRQDSAPGNAGCGAGATANPGDPIDVRPLGTSLVSAHTRTLVRTTAVEVVRLIVRAGQEIPQHKNKGEMIVHCLEGRVALTALGKDPGRSKPGSSWICPPASPMRSKGSRMLPFC